MTSTFGCPHCGKSNPIDTLFCAFCGTNLQDVEANLQAQQSQEDEEGADADLPADIPVLPPRPARRLRGRATQPSPPKEPERSDEPQAPEESPSGLHRPTLRPNTSFARPSPAADETQTPRSAPPVPPEQTGTPVSAPSTPVDWLEPTDLAAWLERFPPSSPQPPPTLTDETRRQLRQLFVAEVPLVDLPPGERMDGGGLQRRPWIYWLLLAGLMAALLFFGDDPPDAAPHAWPGVAQAYTAINALPAGATVLIDWAYDPATAGEMDLVARPVIEHLVSQDVDLVIISQLPLGPATARRLIAEAETSILGETTVRRLDTTLVEGGFLPGGAATLPLLGQAPALGVPVDLQGRAVEIRPPLQTLGETGPVLTLVISARFEPVQRWLEQVQPLNGAPTLAITSAAAGPVVLPYLDSGQLSGVVSGYNGGIGYRELLLRPLARAEQIPLWRQIHGHNAALIVLLIVIVIGNVALSLERRSA